MRVRPSPYLAGWLKVGEQNAEEWAPFENSVIEIL